MGVNNGGMKKKTFIPAHVHTQRLAPSKNKIISGCSRISQMKLGYKRNWELSKASNGATVPQSLPQYLKYSIKTN